MGNSKRGPKHCRSQTPMMPPMWDAVGQNKTRVGTMVTRGQGRIASRNLIGHVAKVERGQRVAGGVKAGSAVRVEGGRRVASMMGVGSMINTNTVDQEFGHHSMNERCPDQSPRSTAQKDVRGAGHSVLSNDLSKFLKLKDEIVKNAQSYIRRHATIICHTLSPDHKAVNCLSAFGDQAQKFAAEVLATVELGHPTLEAPRNLLSACNPQMAPNA